MYFFDGTISLGEIKKVVKKVTVPTVTKKVVIAMNNSDIFKVSGLDEVSFQVIYSSRWSLLVFVSIRLESSY